MAPNIFIVLTVTSAIGAFAAVQFLPAWLPKHHPLIWGFFRLLVIETALYLAWVCEIWPRFFGPLRHLPQPKGGRIPLINHEYVLLRTPPGGDFLRWTKEIPNEGLIRWRGLDQSERLLVTSPKLLGEMLVGHPYDFEKPPKVRSILERVLGHGLIIAEGEPHKFQRKNVMPAFQFRYLKELYPMMWSKSEVLIERLEAQIREQAAPGFLESKGAVTGALEIGHWATKATMDIIGAAALGHEFHTMFNDDNELVMCYEGLLQPNLIHSLFFLAAIIGPPDLMSYLPFKLRHDFDMVCTFLHDQCLKIVKDKRAAIEADAATGTEDKHVDLLSILIKSSNFSDEELTDQVLTFLAAGHETTSSAFTWTTYALAKNRAWQTALRNELAAALPPASSEPLGPDALAALLESLPVLNGVCAETLRLYPTVPNLVRYATRDTTVGGQFIPAGTELDFSPWAINRDPANWARPDEFDPRRWIDEATGKPNKSGGVGSVYGLMTFLHGPRSCIGQNFARQELLCLVANLTRSYEWDLADPKKEVVCSGMVTMKAEGGMHLRLRKLE